MRAVVQRVAKASVMVDKKQISAIGSGLAVLAGVGKNDTPEDALYIADKIVNLRIFADDEDKMNRSVMECGGEILLISQFTLWGDARKGRRPNFMDAAAPERAREILGILSEAIRQKGVTVKEGIFGAMMDVQLVNSGPVTILLDSEKNF